MQDYYLNLSKVFMTLIPNFLQLHCSFLPHSRHFSRILSIENRQNLSHFHTFALLQKIKLLRTSHCPLASIFCISPTFLSYSCLLLFFLELESQEAPLRRKFLHSFLSSHFRILHMPTLQGF